MHESVAVALPRPVLADRLLPHPGARAGQVARGVALVVAGAALTALAAQLRFVAPWTPVPYTGQTGAVLLVGTLLGWRLGAASMLLYVVAGVIGLPVFTGGAHGWEQLAGYTGGYLAGFVLAGALTGALAARGWDRTFGGTAALMLLGNLAIYALGVPVLAAVTGSPDDALRSGALVFLPWDLAKLLVAALALPLAWRLVGERR